MIAILDTTILSNFSLIEHPDLVKAALTEGTITTSQVWMEYQTGAQLGLIPLCDWSWLNILDMDERQHIDYDRLRTHLSAGEASCIAIAQCGGYRIYTDDRAARRIAQRLLLPVSGTLGILARAVDQGVLSISIADGLLGRMIAGGYRAPITSLAEVL